MRSRNAWLACVCSSLKDENSMFRAESLLRKLIRAEACRSHCDTLVKHDRKQRTSIAVSRTRQTSGLATNKIPLLI